MIRCYIHYHHDTLVSYSLMFHLKQRLQIIVYDMRREEENNPDFIRDVLPVQFFSDELIRAAKIYISLQDNPKAQKKYVDKRQASVKEMMSIGSFSLSQVGVLVELLTTVREQTATLGKLFERRKENEEYEQCKQREKESVYFFRVSTPD